MGRNIHAMALGSGEATTLADTRDEWIAVGRAASTPFVRTIQEFDEFVAGEEFKDSPLARLPRHELMRFRNHLVFEERLLNGAAYWRTCVSWHSADLVDDHGFSEEEIDRVASHFGVGPQKRRDSGNKIVDICNDTTCCKRGNSNCNEGSCDC